MNYQPEQNLLQNRYILVTGATDGIGREAAMTYARYGADVILLGRNETKLKQVQEEVHNSTDCDADYWLLDMDSASPEQCHTLAREIARQFPRLDGVLHNAAVLGDIVPMLNQAPEVWQQVMRVNVDTTFFLTQALLPMLLASEAGSPIFTTSSVGHQGRANWGAYAVSKFATEGMMQVLADEYQNHALRVNCINPGGTRTRMRASAFPQEDASVLKTPADIMPLYLYLMGDDSRQHSGLCFDAQPKHTAVFS